MVNDDAVEEEIRNLGADPQLVFVLGGRDDWLICTYQEDGAIQPFLMSDAKAERLAKYLRARKRAFTTIEEARAAFR